MIYTPQIFKNDVLSSADIEQIKQFVYANRKYWSNDIKNDPRVSSINKAIWHSFGMSGRYFGANPSNPEQSADYRKAFIQHFPVRKLIDVLESLFDQPVVLSDNYNFPAFHVLYNPFEHDAEYTVKYMHTDGLYRLEGRKLYSLVYTIELPTAPCGLDWLDADKVEHRINYEVNNLYIFSGDVIPHAISPVSFKPHECRMTLQLFCVEIGNNNLLLTGF